ncbi:MAG: hypothetical protein PHX21_13165 [bacterium]|nr:hypothetical protein [bacterium]
MKKGLVIKRAKKHTGQTIVNSLEIKKGNWGVANSVYRTAIIKKLGESPAARTILPNLEAITKEFIILQTGLKDVYTKYTSGVTFARSPNFMLHAWQEMDSTLLKYFIGEIGGILLNQKIDFQLPSMVFLRDNNGMIKKTEWLGRPSRENDKFVIKKIGEPINSNQYVHFKRFPSSRGFPISSRNCSMKEVQQFKKIQRKVGYLTRKQIL